MLLIKALDSLSMRCLAQRLCEQVILMKLTEKQKNCPYCHAGSDLPSLYNGSPWDGTGLCFERVDDPTTVFVGNNTYGDIEFNALERTLISWGDGTDPLVVGINYCPMCGRSLIKEEE